MNGIAEWKTGIRAQLDQLSIVFEERFGYLFDEDANFVRDADQEFRAGGDKSVFPPALASFYSEVGEVSLPDIHNGYFIHPAERLPVAADWGLPTRVDVGSVGHVSTFGSDGGGGLFCLAHGSEAVYYLPPGQIVEGVYGGGLGRPKRIAPDFATFLRLLLDAVRQFVATGPL